MWVGIFVTNILLFLEVRRLKKMLGDAQARLDEERLCDALAQLG